MKCTWDGCESEGTHAQVGSTSQTWAMLCLAHSTELREALQGDDIRKFLRCYAKAQCGNKITAERVFDRRKTSSRRCDANARRGCDNK